MHCLPVNKDDCWPCFVGSGECSVPASFEIDDGDGGKCYICAEHLKQFRALEAYLSSHPEKHALLEKAIAEVE
jgi:hypothetical protein